MACAFGFEAGVDDNAATQKLESGRLEKREALCYRRLWWFLPESFSLRRIGMGHLEETGCQYWSIWNVMVNLPPQGESPDSRSMSRLWSYLRRMLVDISSQSDGRAVVSGMEQYETIRNSTEYMRGYWKVTNTRRQDVIAKCRASG